MRHSPKALIGYFVSVASVSVAFVITHWLKEWFPTTANSLFFCAIIFSSWLGGFGPGILASLLSILSIKYFLTPPLHTLAISVNEIPRFAVFFFAGLFISWLSNQQRRAQAELRKTRDELEQKVVERTANLQEANEHLRIEIVERKRAEAELRRLNRALRVRSACNQAVTRSTNETELLERVCRAVVEASGYRLAWIGYAEPDAEKTIRPRARAGESLDYVDQVNATWADDERGRGPAGTAVRTGKPIACNATLTDPQFLPWRERAATHGLKSLTALPLIADGRAIGGLFVYADEPDAFDEKETDLLQQATNDLAHGIVALRAKLERDHAKEALQQTQTELTRVARVTAVGELTTSIAHEVNQPLAAVITNANAALRWLARESPDLDEAREAIRRIVRDGNRASDVITRIRALLKKGEAARSPVNLNELVGEIVELARDEIAKRQVSIRTELEPGLRPVAADRVQLQQVLLNLMTNALDSLQAVTDRPRHLCLRTTRSDSDSVMVAVEDSGLGVDPQQAERLFEAFFTTKAHGLGMGLSISRSIIEAHGGRLWATPNNGPGVTFQFTLPLGDEVVK